MKIYYDDIRENVVIENLNRYLDKGSLIASYEGEDVSVSYLDSNIKEVFLNYSLFKKSNGDSAGASASAVVDYLNEQFTKGTRVDGEGSFSLLSATVNITNINLVEGDLIAIFPTTASISEYIFTTPVVGTTFTVKRILIGVGTLVSGLTFKWVKL